MSAREGRREERPRQARGGGRGMDGILGKARLRVSSPSSVRSPVMLPRRLPDCRAFFFVLCFFLETALVRDMSAAAEPGGPPEPRESMKAIRYHEFGGPEVLV